MPTNPPLATLAFSADELQTALDFLKRTRGELSQLRMVRLYRDRLHVFDVNQNYFEVTGVGYPHPEVVPLLQAVNTVYKPDTLHAETAAEFKEFKTGKRYPWAADRVM